MFIQPFSDWGATVTNSLTNALSVFLSAIPGIVAFLVIILVGWLVITVVARGIAALLRSFRLEKLSRESGINEFFRKANLKTDLPGMIGNVLRWFMWLIVLTAAFDALGLHAVSNVMQQWMLWLPNLIVGFVVVVVGGLLANFVGDLVRGATSRSKIGNPETLATISRVAVLSFAVIIALNQMGIAQIVVNTLFIGLVGSLALAFGLAFGLGGRTTADEIVTHWYHKGQQVAANPRGGDGGGRELTL